MVTVQCLSFLLLDCVLGLLALVALRITEPTGKLPKHSDTFVSSCQYACNAAWLVGEGKGIKTLTPFTHMNAIQQLLELCGTVEVYNCGSKV